MYVLFTVYDREYYIVIVEPGLVIIMTVSH